MSSAPMSLDLMKSLVSHINDKEEQIIPQQTFYELEEFEQKRIEVEECEIAEPKIDANVDEDDIDDGEKEGIEKEEDAVAKEDSIQGQECETDEALDEDVDDGDGDDEDDEDEYEDYDDYEEENNIFIAEADSALVIICSEVSFEEAKRFSHEVTDSGVELDIKPCNEESDFSSNCLSPLLYKTMYILVDSNICDVMMRKRRLRDAVDDFFEEFAKTSKVILVNRLPEKEYVRYERLRTQLPESVSEYKEITVSKERTNTDGGIRSKNRRQIHHGVSAVPGEAYLDREYLQNISFEEIPAEEKYVMVGSNCKMNIEKSFKQLIAIKQDGSHNLINVQIVPPTTTTKLMVVITTDPNDPVLEKHLKREINDEFDIINICLSHLGGSIVAIRDGSIVIEIDVEPGRILGNEQLTEMLQMIFQEKVNSKIPKGTSLKVDMDVKNVIPISKLQDYFSDIRSKEDIHKNCVEKKKYEALERELEELKRTLNVVTVSVVLGDITEEKTDVIVNSTNPQLILSDGKVSGVILRAAGAKIQEECKLRHSSGVKVGEVAVTGGGNLRCKKIYHIALVDSWSSKQGDTEESLRDVLTKCLQQADASGHRSISIPALGTGKLNYDPEKVAEIIYDVCLNFQSSGLMEIRLVVHPACSDVHRVFTDVDQRKKKALSRSQSMPSTFQYTSQTTKLVHANADFSRKIQVNWVKGDITKQKVDVVVNSTVPLLNLSSGPLSKAILEAAGDEMQEECKAHYPQGIKQGESAYTSGGRKWNHVYHTALWPWTDVPSLEKPYKDLIKDCLVRVCDYGGHTIAFPLLGTGGLEYPPEEVARWLSEAVEEFQSTHSNSPVHQVNIVVNPKDSKSIKALQGLGKF